MYSLLTLLKKKNDFFFRRARSCTQARGEVSCLPLNLHVLVVNSTYFFPASANSVYAAAKTIETIEFLSTGKKVLFLYT